MSNKDKIKLLLLKRFRIDFDTSEEMFGEGVLSERGCKKLLIKNEYQQLIKEGGRDTALVILAEKYFVSTSTIWGCIYR